MRHTWFYDWVESRYSFRWNLAINENIFNCNLWKIQFKLALIRKWLYWLKKQKNWVGFRHGMLRPPTSFLSFTLHHFHSSYSVRFRYHIILKRKETFLSWPSNESTELLPDWTNVSHKYMPEPIIVARRMHVPMLIPWLYRMDDMKVTNAPTLVTISCWRELSVGQEKFPRRAKI